MKDRHILVTGSSSGIGRAISERLLKNGAKVIGLARDHSKYKPDSDRYTTFTVDVSDLQQLTASLTEMLAMYPCIDGLISNAGYGDFRGLENFSAQQISSFIIANLTSHMVATRILLPHFKSQKKGDIIFIGSEAGLAGGRKGSLYCAAKFGLRGFSQSIRQECSSRNVRVSIVNPGMVRTDFFKNLNFRPGSAYDNAIAPEDVAIAIMGILKTREGTVIDEINLTPIKKVIDFE